MSFMSLRPLCDASTLLSSCLNQPRSPCAVQRSNSIPVCHTLLSSPQSREECRTLKGGGETTEAPVK